MEVGFLGGSPVLDPVPGELYPVTVHTERRGDNLLLSYEGKQIELPSSRVTLSIGMASELGSNPSFQRPPTAAAEFRRYA